MLTSQIPQIPQIPEVNPELGDADTRAELAPHQRPTPLSSGEAKEDQPRGLSRLSEPEEPNLFRVRAETTDTRPRAPRPEPAGGERVQLRRRFARFHLFEAVLWASLDLRESARET